MYTKFRRYSKAHLWHRYVYVCLRYSAQSYLDSACFQVLIFAEKKDDVDRIQEYLLLKGVDVAAIHGGKGKGRTRK